MNDNVKHPYHYTSRAALIEPIHVLRHAPFDLGNALKYMIRAGYKNDKFIDLQKADWYIKCAKESYQLNPKPYDTFLNHYRLILTKFEVFRTIKPKEDFFFRLREINKELIKGCPKNANPMPLQGQCVIARETLFDIHQELSEIIEARNFGTQEELDHIVGLADQCQQAIERAGNLKCSPTGEAKNE